jgi:hypothetical protein
MTTRRSLSHSYLDDVADNNFTCPHCSTLQATSVKMHGFGAFTVSVRQCRSCRDVRIEYRFDTVHAEPWLAIYPTSKPWRGKQFIYAPDEVLKSYDDARLLYTVHTGAAGGYARRALELLLDNAGYVAKTLDAAIKSAKNETDIDRRLPKRLLQKLDYIREIGNFALHTRRDAELVIVEIADEEVAACLETVEELVEYVYEEPVADYLRTVDLNMKLAAAGKKAIDLPQLPPGITHELLGLSPVDAEERPSEDS